MLVLGSWEAMRTGNGEGGGCAQLHGRKAPVGHAEGFDRFLQLPCSERSGQGGDSRALDWPGC